MLSLIHIFELQNGRSTEGAATQQHRVPSSPSNDCERTCHSSTHCIGDYSHTCSISALGGVELLHTSQFSSERHRPLPFERKEQTALSPRDAQLPFENWR